MANESVFFTGPPFTLEEGRVIDSEGRDVTDVPLIRTIRLCELKCDRCKEPLGADGSRVTTTITNATRTTQTCEYLCAMCAGESKTEQA